MREPGEKVKISTRKLFLPILITIIGLVYILAPFGQSRLKSYYYGDAIVYQNRLIIGTTNTTNAEFFELINSRIVRQAVIPAEFEYFSRNQSFFDLAFNIENSRLYCYLVDGRYFYKYELSDPARPRLINKIKDNSWDWFMGVQAAGDHIYTTGPKGSKVWRPEMIVIDAYDLKSLLPDNIVFSRYNDYIFQVDGDKLAVYSRRERKTIAEKDLLLAGKHGNKVFNDSWHSAIYAVDNEALKKINFAGEVEKIFYHISDIGFEVDGLPGSPYLYFSDGIGVVKMDKNDLSPVDWVYTTADPISDGWAMGLKVVADREGEKTVVYNNSSIAVFDDRLKLIDYISATETDYRPQEELFLKLDRYQAPVGARISVSGGGFGINEALEITLERAVTKTRADSQGRFQEIITVPENFKNQNTEVKVSGEETRLHYSISFEIE